MTSSLITHIEHRLLSVYYDVVIAEERLRKFNIDAKCTLVYLPRCKACTYKARESFSVHDIRLSGMPDFFSSFMVDVPITNNLLEELRYLLSR